MAMVITLPNAIRQTDGKWVKEVEIDEMTGEEEDILADQTRKPGGKGILAKSSSQRMTEVLARCTVRVGEEVRPNGQTRDTAPRYFEKHWEKAFIGDRGFATIRLRQYSHGNIYRFEDTCPSCGKQLKNVQVDLADLKVTDIPIELVKDMHPFTAPSGLRVEWRPFVGTDEGKVADIMRDRKSDFLSYLFMLRLATVNGEVPTVQSVKKLKSSDRRAIMEQFDSIEGGIDTNVEIVCDSEACDTEFTRKLAVGNPSFFFPSVTKLASRVTSSSLPRSGDGPWSRSSECRRACAGVRYSGSCDMKKSSDGSRKGAVGAPPSPTTTYCTSGDRGPDGGRPRRRTKSYSEGVTPERRSTGVPFGEGVTPLPSREVTSYPPFRDTAKGFW
jgi:hypothetical protein